MSATASARNLFATITETLIAEIEQGATTWSMPWHRIGAAPMSPLGRRYSGINHLWLSLLASSRSWDSHVWGTYRAWQSAGAQVRKGERSTEVILMAPVEGKDRDADGQRKRFLLAKTYRVFAAEQVDGAEEIVARRRPERPALDSPESIAPLDGWFERVGANVAHGGDRAYYSPLWDEIRLPALAQFKSAPLYYSTRAHETVHWSGHKSRLDRDLSGRFGSDSYAAEELVAELAAALWCGAAGLSAATRDDHAGYLAGWLRVLRADPMHLRTVASRAQAAVSYLFGLAGDLGSLEEPDEALASVEAVG